MLREEMAAIRRILGEIDIAFSLLGDEDKELFLKDEKTQRAVGMTLINIGELVKTISSETRTEYPDVPWRAIAGMRDVTAHKYQTLHMEDVYHTVVMDLPFLKERLSEIAANEEAK